MPTKVKICNIEWDRNNSNIYAQLRNAETGELYISATLNYIFEALRQQPNKYDCVNARTDRFGNFLINVG